MLASLTFTAPALAQDQDDKSDTAAAGFGAGIAAIIADRRKREAGSWAGLDRDRLANGFRLTGKVRSEPHVAAGPPDGPRAPSVGTGELSRGQKAAPAAPARAQASARRGISFGVDGLPDLDPSGAEVEAAPIRSSEEGLPQSSACEGLMPAMSCTSPAKANGGPRLALAYNF